MEQNDTNVLKVKEMIEAHKDEARQILEVMLGAKTPAEIARIDRLVTCIVGVALGEAGLMMSQAQREGLL
jgi:hypothetical protein